MLDPLFGSKTIKKVLLFLFVNEKCYGTQLHKILKTPLTPIQKSLARLEKGGVIMSYYEGKTRIFQFSPAYPLLSELESLLKKAYTLLSTHEKKAYSVFKSENGSSSLNKQEHENLLMAFWERLSFVNELTFHAKSQLKETGHWHGKGKGFVTVTREGETTLIFNEKGSWHGEKNHEMDFSNVFRWTLDRPNGMISLEHLRYGPNNPIFLFHLAPTNPRTLTSVDSHLCEGDTYFGQILCDTHSLRLNWRVIGPKKNDELDYYYS